MSGLVVEDLTMKFGGVTAVDGFSFNVPPGEVVALMGWQIDSIHRH